MLYLSNHLYFINSTMKSQISSRETIVLGVIYNQTRDKVLISRRRTGVHQAGLWELPGGKLNPDEPPLQALKRELEEELGISIGQTHPLAIVQHDYADRKVRLRVLVIDNWTGTPNGKEGQLIEWVSIDELNSVNFPQANRHITRLIGLPSLYLITPDKQTYDDRFLQQAFNFLKNGLKLLQFRSKSPVSHQHEQVVRSLVQQCDNHSATLLYNGSADEAVSLGAHGVHLNSVRLMQLQNRPLPDDKWVAASCHNARELEHAVAIGVDFCVLSPVNTPVSHPYQNGFGWRQFQDIAVNSSMPIYALGGIKAEDLAIARNSGAHGIAMISGIWSAADPFELIRSVSQY